MTDVPTTAAICATVGLLSADEMSDVLKVSTQTLATWRCKKRGPPSIKLGKKVFYLLADFSQWMQDEVTRQREDVRASRPRKPRVVRQASAVEEELALVQQ